MPFVTPLLLAADRREGRLSAIWSKQSVRRSEAFGMAPKADGWSGGSMAAGADPLLGGRGGGRSG